MSGVVVLIGSLKDQVSWTQLDLVGLHLATGRDARIFEVLQGWMVASGGISDPLAVLAPKVQKVALRPRILKTLAKSGEFPFGVGFYFWHF